MRCVFRLFNGSNGEVSTSSSFLRLLLAPGAADAEAAAPPICVKHLLDNQNNLTFLFTCFRL